LVPAVPAPFVPQQSVKLKSTGGSEKVGAGTAVDVPAAPAAESPSPPKPMFKLRSTGFGLNGSPNPNGDASTTPTNANAASANSPAARPGLTHQTSKSGEYKAPASFVPKTATSNNGVSPLLSVKLRSTGILNNEVNNNTTNEVHIKATVPTPKGNSSSSSSGSFSGNAEGNVPSQIVKLRSVAAARAAEEAGNESESTKGRRLDMNQ